MHSEEKKRQRRRPLRTEKKKARHIPAQQSAGEPARRVLVLVFCFLLLFVTACAYMTALFVHKKAALVFGVTIPLVVFGFFKYF